MAVDVLSTPAVSAKRPSVRCAKDCDTRSDRGTWRFNQRPSLERYLLSRRVDARVVPISRQEAQTPRCVIPTAATGRNACSFAACDCTQSPFPIRQRDRSPHPFRLNLHISIIHRACSRLYKCSSKVQPTAHLPEPMPLFWKWREKERRTTQQLAFAARLRRNY